MSWISAIAYGLAALGHAVQGLFPTSPGDWWLELWTGMLFAATLVIGFATFFIYRVAQVELRHTSESLHHSARAADVSAAAAASQQYGEVATGMYRLSRMFMEHPELQKYFYAGAEPPEMETEQVTHTDTEALHVHLELVCEQIMDFADSLTEQKRALEGLKVMDWSTWDAYFRFLYRASPYLRQFIRENIDFYPDYLLAIFGFINVRRLGTGEILGQWDATEVERAEDEEGASRRATEDEAWRHVAELWPEASAQHLPIGSATFPWIRTWLIRKVDSRTVALLATTPSLEGKVARVRTLNRGVDATALAVLDSWLVGLLEGSGLHWVVMADEGSNGHGPERRYDLREHGAHGTGLFTIRAYTPVTRRGP